MSKTGIISSLTLCSCVLCGCVSWVMDRVEAHPAVLTNPSEETTLELGYAAKALLGLPVTLGPGAFVESSRLSLEKPRQGQTGNPDYGDRLLDPPQRLQLLTDGKLCMLEASSGERVTLVKSHCRLESP